MKKYRLGILIGITVAGVSLLFSGCGKKKDQSLTESIEEAVDKATETTDDVDASGENKEQITPEGASEGVDFSIDDTLVGRYEYDADEDQGDCIFEIFRIGDGYYIEYNGECDYAGAELQINSRKDEMNCMNYNTTLYAFSGFSFMGEYWGKGTDVQITAYQNGDIVLSQGQPFLDHRELPLKRLGDASVSESQTTENGSQSELIGTWRCVSERDGDVHEITMVFTKDGNFRAVDKVKEQPPAVYVGEYVACGTENDSEGSIDFVRFAYGGMPDSWVLKYDQEGKHPYVYSDYMYAEPFTYYEGDGMKLPFQRVSDSEKSSIAMGPGSRSGEIQKLFDEYLNGTDGSNDTEYENEQARQEEIPDSEYIEDVIYYAHAYTNAPICELDSVTTGPNGEVVAIHCYEIVGEGENAHTATWDWIYYERNTGKYYDFFGNEIDMSKY